VLAGEELEVAVQLYPGGTVDLVVDLATHEAADDLKAIARDALIRPGSPGWTAELACRLLDSKLPVVRALRLGSLPEEWAQLQPLVDRLPRSVRVRDVIGNPERRVDTTIGEALKVATGNAAWAEDGPDGGLHVRPEATAIADRLESGANALLPAFVSQVGALRVEIAKLGSWADGVPRSLVRWQYSGEDSVSHFNMLGAGIRRWVAAGLDAACGDILRSAAGAVEPLYLIDEPEMHLHPLAQVEVLEWIEARVVAGATAVLATHSPLILATSRQSASLIGLVREGTSVSQIDITASLLDAIGGSDGLAEAIGSDRIAALQLTRGILVVEGEHDRKVIGKFFGVELARARIRMLPIRGTGNAKALADSELFASLGLPLCLVFDEVRERVIANRDLNTAPTAEERKMIEVLDAFAHFEHRDRRVDYAGFALPDVICAIPIPAVRRAFPAAQGNVDWPAVIAEWRSLRQQKTGFKPFALKLLGLERVNPDQFVEASLLAIQPEDIPAPELIRAVKTAEAKLLGPRKAYGG
ncbi:MAG: ATP-dependent nuclease, partial [Acidimicrobiales bacterium]